MSTTTDRSNPDLYSKDELTGQNKAYLVLSDEERAKDFVRPVRNSYVHTGKKIEFAGNVRMLTAEELDNVFTHEGWVAFLEIKDPARPSVSGQCLTQKEYDNYENGFIKGCGALTTMSKEISETYARDPKFYSSTYCMGCKAHLPVGEFTWDKTNETVGS